MEKIEVTIVITPRDRYSGIIECIENVYALTTEPFYLKLLDLGYPAPLKQELIELIDSKNNAKIYSYGKIIPMEAIRNIRNEITTQYTMFLDNDSNVTQNWLAPLLTLAKAEKAAVINPLTLEKEGVDKGAPLRNHLYTNEIRVISIGNTDYLIEDKHFRRALPNAVPSEIRASEMFEFHGVLFDSQVLKCLDIPQMVIREHIDIAMQIHKMKRKILTQPQSVIIFDNLGTRMNFIDMRWFFFRWSSKNTKKSSRLFEQRWGLNFYAEQAMYHWVFRRRIFLFCRWLHLPISASNNITRLFAKIKTIFKPIWDPIKNPLAKSVSFYQRSPFK